MGYLTRQKCLLPNDASEQIVQDQGMLTAQELMLCEQLSVQEPNVSALYLSMTIRPDIAYAIGLLSQFRAKLTLPISKLMIYHCNMCVALYQRSALICICSRM